MNLLFASSASIHRLSPLSGLDCPQVVPGQWTACVPMISHNHEGPATPDVGLPAINEGSRTLEKFAEGFDHVKVVWQIAKRWGSLLNTPVTLFR